MGILPAQIETNIPSIHGFYFNFFSEDMRAYTTSVSGEVKRKEAHRPGNRANNRKLTANGYLYLTYKARYKLLNFDWLAR